MGRKRSRSYSSDSSEDDYLRHRIKRLRRRLKEKPRNQKDRHDQSGPSRAISSSRNQDRRHHQRRLSNSEDSYYSSCSRSSFSRSRSRSKERPPFDFKQASPHPPAEEVFVDCPAAVETVDPLRSDLDDRVLNIMGTDGTKVTSVGEPIHEILASQYKDFLRLGLPAEAMAEIIKKYPFPENCNSLQGPKLNPEVKAAINDSGKKRDDRLLAMQNMIGTALAAVGKAVTILLKKEDKDNETLSVIECLSDAGRVLAKVHHTESESRRSIILGFSLQNNLQPLLKEALTDAPLDGWLFGTDLSERLKAAKALEKSVADLKATHTKSRSAFQSKDLNYQSPFRQPKKSSRYQQPQQRRGGQNKYRSQTQREREERGKRIFRRRNKYYSAMALDPKTLPVEKKALHAPALEEVAQVFRAYLPSNFAEVNVEIVDCPDLSKRPFLLADKGLSGNPKLIEFGGPPYLLPLVNREKVYDLRDIAKLAGAEPTLLIGAGAGSHPYIGVNCEGIVNLKISNGTVDQQTRISKVDGQDEHMVVQVLPNNETRVALLGNLYSSEAKPGKVIKVHVKKRIGQKNFIETLRNSIEEHYRKDQLVGIGGTFLLAEGKVKQHVMRDFSKTPLLDDDALNNWLKFYEMSAPLTVVGTFTSNDGGDLDLRVQHFHSFGTHGEAGHYHYDTTPENVEYLGYFNVAKELVRIDKPVDTHKFGRD